MKGRHAFDRCRRCERKHWFSDCKWHFEPTGRLRTRVTVGRRHNVEQAEMRCTRGHVFWTSHSHSITRAKARDRVR